MGDNFDEGFLADRGMVYRGDIHSLDAFLGELEEW
jgi:hypothetical protein